jgi:monoamine oxidase
MREEIQQIWNQEFHEIAGGTELLPAAFASRLKSKPAPGCEIVRIEQDAPGKRVSAFYRDTLGTGKIKRADGDYLICTIPFPALQRLEISPPFSNGKQRAIRQLNYDSSTKVLFDVKNRFWESDDHIFGGGIMTDLPTGMTFFPSDNAEARDQSRSAGPGVFLASYTWGQAARRIAALAHPARTELVLRHLSRAIPALNEPGMIRSAASWSWDAHPWSGGAFAWFMPGQHTALHRHVVSPEARIFFAGEHASLSHTWMQGALESALRAVREILLLSRSG